jgi:RNAse (barnase) inhibitor barstar
MDSKKHFIIDGEKMQNKMEFYNEIHRVLCPKFAGFGKNLDAFVDILRGGFGNFSYGEPIIIEFKNYNIANRKLGDVFFSKIISILKENEDIELIPKIENESSYR